MSTKDRREKRVLVAAHRGNSRYFPENTLPAIRSALELKVDNLEFDLHMTSDGEIVLMHDHTVDRTTNGHGPVRSFTLKEIKALDAGFWKAPQFAGTRVPLFEELLETIRGNESITLNVEFKDYPSQDRPWAHQSAEKALSLIERYGVAQRCTINSWSGELLEHVAARYDGRYKLHGYYPLELMGEGMRRNPYDILHCICLFGTREEPVCPKEVFDYAFSRGVEPWAYFPDDNACHIELAARNGAVLITSNDPQRTMQLLAEKGFR